MSNGRFGKGRMAIIALPFAGALMIGAGGYAWATGTGTGADGSSQASTTQPGAPAASSHGSTSPHSVRDSNDGPDGHGKARGEQHEKPGNEGDSHDEDADKAPSYTSSVTTTAKEDSGNEAAANLALAKLAKLDVGQAATAAMKAVPGSKAIEVDLSNEGGNVVYQVEVADQKAQTEVTIDAGNGSVLAKSVDRQD